MKSCTAIPDTENRIIGNGESQKEREMRPRLFQRRFDYEICRIMSLW